MGEKLKSMDTTGKKSYSYNIYSVRWLKIHCHKNPNIRNFNCCQKCSEDGIC